MKGIIFDSTVRITLFLLFYFLPLVSSIEWLAFSLDTALSWNSTSDCSRAKNLNKQQRLVCERHLEMMAALQEAGRDVIDVCQELFSDKRWNCSSILLTPNYSPDLTGGSREQAYIYALASAAASRAVARACSSGISSRCSCSTQGTTQDQAVDTTGYYRWGGCGDDVRYGEMFGKSFVDSAFMEKKRSKRSLMNLQNNAVGRKILEESLTSTCKCHGVSGSCTVKTCYKVLPALKSIGKTLQKRYHTAVEVKRPKKRKSGQDDDEEEDGSALKSKRRRRDKTRDLVGVMTTDPITDDDLVYYTISPDYCLPDLILGSVGTKDRECDKEGTGSGGCRSMCCGRGFKTETVEQQYRCDCRYYWCCYVKCKTCTRVVQIHRCR